MFLWMTLRDPVDAVALLNEAVEAGVAFVPGRAFFVDDDPASVAGGIADRSIRLSFVTATPEQIDKAVATLADVVSRRRDRRAA